MVVVMLAAEEPIASTPRRGMDCAGKAKTANKKLVQARLTFKRLNPEIKECSEPKRTKGPVAPKCTEPSVSDGENDVEQSPLTQRRGPALVNGRGPLDSFMSRSMRSSIRSTPKVTIDLTEDNSTDAVKQQPVPTVAAICPVTVKTTTRENSRKSVELTTPLKDEETDKDEEMEGETLPMMDTTLESDTEEEEQQETEISRENESVLSAGSTSSLSAVESSPEPSRSAPSTPASALQTNAAENKMKRRSLKSVQEQEEKQRLKDEKERLKQEAKAAKEKKKEEARMLKEEKEREKKEKKEKEEKERREKKEREEKEKAEKQRAKEEQRQMKMEAKLEEKRKKEEEKRLKEEKERLKAGKAEITRFLQKAKTHLAPKTLASACGKFAPFEIKEHMSLAPLTRVQCEDAVLEELDRYLAQPDSTLNGLKDWTKHKPRRSGPTRPHRINSVRDCLVVTESVKADGVPDRHRYGRMKLLHFQDNYRPAYWGTYSKKSKYISPRCPLRQDKDLLDYEVDSDEEWEEEEPGESLSHSEGDDDDEAGDDDDDDDGFFVPHGYLSEGEGALEEDEEGGDPEKLKVRQKIKAREWENEQMSKRKVKVLEPVVRGCRWEGEEPIVDFLRPYAVCMLEPLPKDVGSTPERDLLRQKRNEKLLSQLLPLLHGNVNSSKLIINEFLEFCRQQTSPPTESPLTSTNHIPSRIQVRRLIKESGVYEKRSTYRRCCWYVHADVLARHSQEALPVPCQWTYITSGAQITREEPAGSRGNSPASQSTSSTPSNKRKSASCHSITKYLKKCDGSEQVEAMENDGFQADTEDDEDDDCVTVGEQSVLSQLLPLLHGNVNSSKLIINEFLEFCRQQTSPPTESPLTSTNHIPSRIQVRRLIKESGVYEKRSTYRRCCWYVHADVLARHSQEALPVPCQWTYITSGAQITREEPAGSQGNSPTSQSTSSTPSNKRKSASCHSITKYLKKCDGSEQVDAMETDGFQADTEDDEDDDCVIVGEQSVCEQDGNTSLAQAKENAEPMDTNASETAALNLPCPTPATA